MKKKEILQQKIKIYENIFDRVGQEACLGQFLGPVSAWKKAEICLIRSEKNEAIQKELKKKLPCATLSCICGNEKSEILSQNKILCLDIDKDDNPWLGNDEILKNTAYRIFNEKYVFAVSRSVRGQGLMVLVVIKDVEKFADYFKCLEKIMLEKHNVTIDGQCKNINRLRFVSYDDKIINGEWLKEEVEEFDEVIEEEKVEVVFEEKDVENINKEKIKEFNEINSLVNDDLFVACCIMYLITKCEYRSNDYYSWLQDGFRMSLLGDKYYFLFRQLSRASSGYKNDNDVRKKWENCIRESKMSRGSLSYYFMLLKKKLGSGWKLEIMEYELKLLEEIKNYKTE